MTFYPLPRKGEQEMQEENNDNYKLSPSPLYLIWPSPSLCRWGLAGITPVLLIRTQMSAPCSKSF